MDPEAVPVRWEVAEMFASSISPSAAKLLLPRSLGTRSTVDVTGLEPDRWY
jgi:phosphodiesterase/alkaline phosphatase D-like protein